MSQTKEESIISLLEYPYQMVPIRAVKVNEVKYKIRGHINTKNTHEYDLINEKVIKGLSEKFIVVITHICNSILRNGHLPNQLEVAQIILIRKYEIHVEKMSSYRPILLLPMLSKLFQKLFLQKLNPQLIEFNTIPENQYVCTIVVGTSNGKINFLKQKV